MQIRSGKRLLALAIALGAMFLAALVLTWFATRERQRANAQAAHAMAARHLADKERASAEHQVELAKAANEKLQSSLRLFAAASENVDATKLEATIDTRTATILPRVYMNIVNESDRDNAAQVSRSLREGGIIVLGPKVVPKAVLTLHQTEVRYYKREDQGFELDQIVKRVIAAGYPDTKIVYLNLENNQNVRKRHYEVWLLPKAATP